MKSSTKKPAFMTMRRRHMLTGMLFVAPWCLGFLIFTLYPMYDTLMMSFSRVRITGFGILREWVGIDNYRDIIVNDINFISALTDYLMELVLFVPLILIFSLIIAMLLNLPGKLRGMFRTIFFLPVIIASGPVLSLLLSEGALHLPGNAVIIDTLMGFGFLPMNVILRIIFLIESFTMILWHSGLQILIFLAALQKMDPALVEAAQIDGASRWVVFWRLTLVQLNPMIVINTLFTVVTLSIFSTNPILTKITTDMFDVLLGFGYASAITWIYFVILVVIIGIAVFITRRRPDKIYGG